MNKEKKKLSVEIFGDQYMLISDEKEEHILHAAGLVDTIMNEIAQKTNMGDAKRVAVLVALRLASELTTLEANIVAIEHHKEKLIELIDKKGLCSSL